MASSRKDKSSQASALLQGMKENSPTKECDYCKKRQVVLHASFDPRYYVGKCTLCGRRTGWKKTGPGQAEQENFRCLGQIVDEEREGEGVAQ